MTSDESYVPQPAAPEPPRPLTTNGAIARRRRLRTLLLILLTLLLAALAYAAYFYALNRRAPSISIAATEATNTVQPYEYLYAFSGDGDQAMNQPSGIALIGDRCYVTDYAYRTVRAYTRDGAYLFEFGAIKDGANTSMNSPVHLAVGPDDTIWVTDRGRRALYVFDQDGKFKETFHPNGDAAYKWAPLALTFDEGGDLFVTDVQDPTKHQVIAFDPAGKITATWGKTKQVVSAMEDPGTFFFPNGIAVEGTGSAAIVYVADGDNRRVQEFRTDGTSIRIINTSGTPRGLALDKKGNLFVTDALAHRVGIYTSEGDMLGEFGENGAGPGQFNFPNDLTLDPNGRAFITDRANDRVQVWGPLTGQIPGITNITPGNAWIPATLGALLLLFLLWLWRRPRRFVVMPDFVDSLATIGMVSAMTSKRFRWVQTEQEHAAFAGRVVEGIDLGEVIEGVAYSDTEASTIKEKLEVGAETAAVLALAKWARTLCTQDVALARHAISLGIDVYDRDSWLRKFAPKQEPAAAEE